eukprot:jgi/Ulvmu1/2327/UM013_0175.1
MQFERTVEPQPGSGRNHNESLDVMYVYGDSLETCFDDLGLGSNAAADSTHAIAEPSGKETLPSATNYVRQVLPCTQFPPQRLLLPAEIRKEKTRARNRRSQAGFRQRQKEEIHRLQTSIQEKQQLLTTSKARLAALHQKANNTHAQTTQSITPRGENCRRYTECAYCPPSPAPTAALPLQQTHLDVIRCHPASPFNHAPSPLPRRISSFRATAGICYADLLEASGSKTGVLDFTAVSMAALIRSVRVAKAARLGCAESDVCFFMQLHWLAVPGAGWEGADADAPGLPLSMSSTLSTPECVASSIVMYLFTDLEGLLQARWCRRDVPQPNDDAGSPDLEKSRAGPVSAVTAAAQHAAKRQCARGTVPRAAAPASRSACPRPCPNCELKKQKDGTPAQLQQHGDCDSDTRGYQGQKLPPCAVWSGRVTCGVHQSCCARCAVRGIVRQIVRQSRGRERGEALRDMCGKVLNQVVAMVEGVRGGSNSGGGVGGGVGGRVGEQRAMLVASINSAASGVLGVVRDVLEELLAGGDLELLCGSGSGRSVPCTAAEQEAGFVAVVSIGSAITQVHRDSMRIAFTMGINAMRPLLKYFEVENLRVQLYRQLGLSAADKERMADVWQAWERLRRSLNEPHAAALAALRNLPGPDVLPDDLLRCITASCGIPAVTSQHLQHAKHADGNHVKGWTSGSRGAEGVMHDRDAYGPRAYRGEHCAEAARDEQTRHLYSVGLPGECPLATEAAANALRDLVAVHQADAAVYLEMGELTVQPGAVLGLDKMARCWSAHLMHEVAHVEFMSLCQLAAAQRSRARATRVPQSDPSRVIALRALAKT